MTPRPRLPPCAAVPYRFPFLSKTTAIGYPPSVASSAKSCNTVSVQAPVGEGESSNATPYPDAPKFCVVPYRFPLASKTKLPYCGNPPSFPPVKLYKMVSVQEPLSVGDNSKTVPYTWVPPKIVVP